MNAAILSLAPLPASPDERASCAAPLSNEERAALIAAAMAHGIELLQAAERLNVAGQFDRSDAMKACALALVRAELKLRNFGQ